MCLHAEFAVCLFTMSASASLLKSFPCFTSCLLISGEVSLFHCTASVSTSVHKCVINGCVSLFFFWCRCGLARCLVIPSMHVCVYICLCVFVCVCVCLCLCHAALSCAAGLCEVKQSDTMEVSEIGDSSVCVCVCVCVCVSILTCIFA